MSWAARRNFLGGERPECDGDKVHAVSHRVLTHQRLVGVVVAIHTHPRGIGMAPEVIRAFVGDEEKADISTEGQALKEKVCFT
jgi:hypothetical protein